MWWVALAAVGANVLHDNLGEPCTFLADNELSLFQMECGYNDAGFGQGVVTYGYPESQNCSQCRKPEQPTKKTLCHNTFYKLETEKRDPLIVELELGIGDTNIRVEALTGIDPAARFCINGKFAESENAATIAVDFLGAVDAGSQGLAEKAIALKTVDVNGYPKFFHNYELVDGLKKYDAEHMITVLDDRNPTVNSAKLEELSSKIRDQGGLVVSFASTAKLNAAFGFTIEEIGHTGSTNINDPARASEGSSYYDAAADNVTEQSVAIKANAQNTQFYVGPNVSFGVQEEFFGLTCGDTKDCTPMYHLVRCTNGDCAVIEDRGFQVLQISHGKGTVVVLGFAYSAPSNDVTAAGYSIDDVYWLALQIAQSEKERLKSDKTDDNASWVAAAVAAGGAFSVILLYTKCCGWSQKSSSKIVKK